MRAPRISLAFVAVALGAHACAAATSDESGEARTTSASAAPSQGDEELDNGNAPPPPPPPEGQVRVAFRDVRTETPGCFFFSGPLEHGRDDHLGERAFYREGVLSFSETLRFEPQASASPTDLVLVRESLHAHGGQWRVRETITLTPSGAGFVGSYHYDEFSPDQTAPGTCHIDARVELWP